MWSSNFQLAACPYVCQYLSAFLVLIINMGHTTVFTCEAESATFPETFDLNHQGLCASVWCSLLYTYIVLKPVFVFSLIFVFILPWLFSEFLLHISFKLLPLFRPSQITQSIYSPRATTDKITLIAGIDFEGVWQFDLNKRFVRTTLNFI